MGVKRIIGRGLLLLGTFFLFLACQDVFSASLFGWAALDPADLSDEQLEAYAKTVAKSGDTEAMAQAYEAVSEKLPEDVKDDPGLYLLASNLGFGKAKVTDALAEAVKLASERKEDDLPLTGLPPKIQEMVDNMDEESLRKSVEHFSAVADEPEVAKEISDSQYTNAAVASLLLAYKVLKEGEALDKDDPQVKQAKEWAEAANYDLSSLPIDF